MKKQVIYLYRGAGNAYSIETVFHNVGKALPENWCCQHAALPCTKISIRSLFRNWRWCRRYAASPLLHITGANDYAALFFPKRKVILTVHDNGTMNNLKLGPHFLIYWFFWCYWPVKHAGIVTCISEFTKQQLVHYAHIAPDKVYVIPNPVNPMMIFSPNCFHDLKPVVLFIGTKVNKNLNRVIQALTGVNCHLRIIGSLTEDIISGLNTAKVVFSSVENLQEKEIIEEYRQCDLLLFPSLFEGFGLPIVEAQATGRPVITSDRDPMREIAGEGACLVDPESVESIRNGVLKVIQDAAYRENLIQKGLHNVLRFRADKIAAQYARLYSKLLAEQD